MRAGSKSSKSARNHHHRLSSSPPESFFTKVFIHAQECRSVTPPHSWTLLKNMSFPLCSSLPCSVLNSPGSTALVKKGLLGFEISRHSASSRSACPLPAKWPIPEDSSSILATWNKPFSPTLFEGRRYSGSTSSNAQATFSP